VQKGACGCGERLTTGNKKLNIKDLRNGMRRVTVEAKVVEKGEPRQVRSRYKDETYTVADAKIEDETGSIKLTLWNEQIDQVNVDNKIKIENGYVTSFKGEIQLNVGKFGTLTVE
jgi:replication factor A1